MKRRAVVVCPGRGTYTKGELGYLRRYRPRLAPLLDGIDRYLVSQGQKAVTELDQAEKFSPAVHTRGENAAGLIYACGMADWHAIDREQFEIVAVTGNSMGWYTALACGGAFDEAAVPDAAIRLVHTMGSMMKDGVVGGQILYPIVGDDWRLDAERLTLIERALGEVQAAGLQAHWSIRFGGYAVIGGDEAAIKMLSKMLPSVDEGKYPFVLVNHAAFHTPLMDEVSRRAFASLPSALFRAPTVPLVDGRGVIWQPYSTDPEALRFYTLYDQVCSTYDFHAALAVSLKEFAPDCLILLGPGATSGGAIGQILVQENWWGIGSKADFSARQESEPVLMAMGRAEQRALVARD